MKLHHMFFFAIFSLALFGCQYEDSVSPNYDCSTCDSSGSFRGNGNFNSEEAGVGETYNDFVENPFVKVEEEPISTFSIDADGGSYSNVRRFLNGGQIPPSGAIRTEELINYFPLDYDEPAGNEPIALNGEVSECPWNTNHKLVRVGIQGKTIPEVALPPSNIVLLIDVSGSMNNDDKLPLLKSSFKLLVDEFTSKDRIAIVTYAGEDKVVLQSTSGEDKRKIKKAIDKLGSGGGTAGAKGIITAYKIAVENFLEGGNNRVIVGTDGDFNIGPSSQEEIVALIEEKRESGVFLTTLGVGTGNYNDAILEQLANNGNGTYEYIDNLEQAKKVFIEEYGKFYTVAKDVKVQVEFNPSVVQEYRLIGYENRLLETEDFEDDKKDAGEIGAGQNITALYEIIPTSPSLKNANAFTIDFRYKLPDRDVSAPLQLQIPDANNIFAQASENHRFVGSVAAFGMVLRDSKFNNGATYDNVLDWLSSSSNFDPYEHRKEFREVVLKAKAL